jgi:hypothetical protein
LQAVEHGAIGKAHDLRAGVPQVRFSSLVVRTQPLMHGAVDFDDQA